MINGQIYAANLPERDKIVYLYIKERCGTANQCFPSMKTIAKDLCVCKKTVKRAVHELEKNGYIHRTAMEREWREEYIALPNHEVVVALCCPLVGDSSVPRMLILTL